MEHHSKNKIKPLALAIFCTGGNNTEKERERERREREREREKLENFILQGL